MALTPVATRWPVGGGELGAMLRERDWAATPLGPAADWSPTLRSAIDLMLGAQTEIVLFWGPDYIAFYNDAYAPTIGHKHPHALGRPAVEHWSELWDDLEPLLAGVRNSGQTFSAHDRPFQIDRQGFLEQVWFDISYSAVHDGDGAVAGVMCIVSETTERMLLEAARRRAETELRESHEQLRLAEAAGGVGLFLIDLASNTITASPEFCRLFGLPALGSFSASLVERQFLPETLEVASNEDRRRSGEATLNVEYRIRKADSGEQRWISRRAEFVRDPAGKPVLMRGAVQDVTERKLAEAEQRSLQEALARANATLEQRVEERTRDRDRMWRLSTDLILVADFANRITAANPAWDKLLGWPENALIGTGFLDLVDPADRERTGAEAARLAAGQITQRFENRLRHRDGSYRTISWIAVPDGGLIHAVGRDISAERDAAEALHEAEERLRQSQKMESLGQLTGGIAHDFNNLLQGISGSLDVMRRRIASGRADEVERFMDSATQSVHRAAALIHRLLAFARRQSLDSKPVDISTLVGSMEELLRRTLGEQVSLAVEAGIGVWPVQSDENQLESAVLNLALNARDAMPHGGRLTIATANASLDESYTRLHEGLLPGDYALLSVADSGVGMSAEVLTRVFEPFFTTKPIGQGTGLGLSMIYGFAKQSGGHVRIASEPGRGTTVQLYLPRHAAAAPPAALAAQAPPQLPGEGQTILVVEDDPAVRLIVLDELGELGYRTLEAIDGPSALPILKSPRRIDLMLSDVGLPGMNGRQVAEIARQQRPGLPVLFMTGYAENAAARAEFLAPGMRMIAKPFAMDDLTAAIAQILTAAPAAEPPDTPT